MHFQNVIFWSHMGIDCSKLHLQAVSYFQSRLGHAKDTELREGSSMAQKSVISELSKLASYHDRLNRAYSVLHRYESTNGLNSLKEDSHNGEGTGTEKLSPWASESLLWISAASENEAQESRFMPSFSTVSSKEMSRPLTFSKFAMACQLRSGDSDQVYLTKKKQRRLPILRRIFNPLLKDLFVFKVVYSLFCHLGIDEDFDMLQIYFGEWINNLPVSDLARSNMSDIWRPMVRWLHDLILNAFKVSKGEQHKLDGNLFRRAPMLESLIKFIKDMEDLPKAFLLAVICMEAVSSASLYLETKTYGTITQLESIQPWVALLRKLRVCLLVSLRLGGDVNPNGAIHPMTVSNVSCPGIFSAYSWIARDELTLSHDNRVIIALESACLSSSRAFYPSTVAGDNTQHKKEMFDSCGDNRSLRNPTGLNESDSQPLMFYLKDYTRFTTHLAANRALILASMWGQTPGEMPLLRHAMSALETVADCVESFSLATLVEIYQSQIRPVCRALLFGFGEHELSEHVVTPLIEDSVWLCEFISVAKKMLSMIIDGLSNKKKSAIEDPEPSEMWPPLRECSVLNFLVRKLRDVQPSSVEMHHTIIFAFEMTRHQQYACLVPSFAKLFLTGALFSEIPSLPKGSTQQKELLNQAIISRAENQSDPIVNSFAGIKDVELFGKALQLDVKYVRTQYLIEMIRLGKDSSINDLLGASSPSLDKVLFVQKVVQIICSRLNATIASKNYRGTLSLLDADACHWVQEEATKCMFCYVPALLVTTHSTVTRIQSMSDSLEGSLSKKIDALCIMSGTLLKAVQAQEQESMVSA